MLTTTPVGACVVVDPVDVDVVSEPVVCSVGVVVVSLAAFVESGAFVDGDSEDGDSDDDGDDGVSANAIGSPYPVATAAPTPRTTAKVPTRPTYIAERMTLSYTPA
ncbi:hypothetical protein [Mycolicibacterium moriokaense]|uniref:hypothetical protein n=1 Tax=Mycolicibacterium moriokaense TaxID=39691 RepID=UPI001F1E4C30|nr:hypothetical protein [Mycolicibacterium moriokaense]